MRKKAAALEQLQPGTPCPLCGRPMYREQALDLDHITPLMYGGDPTGPTRLTHARCNRARGAAQGNRARRAVMRVRVRSGRRPRPVTQADRLARW